MFGIVINFHKKKLPNISIQFFHVHSGTCTIFFIRVKEIQIDLGLILDIKSFLALVFSPNAGFRLICIEIDLISQIYSCNILMNFLMLNLLLIFIHKRPILTESEKYMVRFETIIKDKELIRSPQEVSLTWEVKQN